MYSTYVFTGILKADWLNYSVLVNNNNIWPHNNISSYVQFYGEDSLVLIIGSKAYT